ncbi:unnamed protein product [Amoebophrya sp. A120]|nr:unnamed protein product [Amoebophrya sp. A120]|eukprot:GSA120T00014614001.1
MKNKMPAPEKKSVKQLQDGLQPENKKQTGNNTNPKGGMNKKGTKGKQEDDVIMEDAGLQGAGEQLLLPGKTERDAVVVDKKEDKQDAGMKNNEDDKDAVFYEATDKDRMRVGVMTNHTFPILRKDTKLRYIPGKKFGDLQLFRTGLVEEPDDPEAGELNTEILELPLAITETPFPRLGKGGYGTVYAVHDKLAVKRIEHFGDEDEKSKNKKSKSPMKNPPPDANNKKRKPSNKKKSKDEDQLQNKKKPAQDNGDNSSDDEEDDDEDKMGKDDFIRLHRELDLMMQCSHANVIGFRGGWVSVVKSWNLFILMERGIPLNKFRWKQIGETLWRLWEDDLVEGVRYLEKLGYGHRDLKRENLFLMARDEAGRLVLVVGDLGTAKLFSAALGDAGTHSPRSSCGTGAYTPPETASYLQETSSGIKFVKGHDYWAIGHIICEVLSDAGEEEELMKLLCGKYWRESEDEDDDEDSGDDDDDAEDDENDDDREFSISFADGELQEEVAWHVATRVIASDVDANTTRAAIQITRLAGPWRKLYNKLEKKWTNLLGKAREVSPVCAEVARQCLAYVPESRKLLTTAEAAEALAARAKAEEDGALKEGKGKKDSSKKMAEKTKEDEEQDRERQQSEALELLRGAKQVRNTHRDGLQLVYDHLEEEGATENELIGYAQQIIKEQLLSEKAISLRDPSVFGGAVPGYGPQELELFGEQYEDHSQRKQPHLPDSRPGLFGQLAKKTAQVVPTALLPSGLRGILKNNTSTTSSGGQNINQKNTTYSQRSTTSNRSAFSLKSRGGQSASSSSSALFLQPNSGAGSSSSYHNNLNYSGGVKNAFSSVPPGASSSSAGAGALQLRQPMLFNRDEDEEILLQELEGFDDQDDDTTNKHGKTHASGSKVVKFGCFGGASSLLGMKNRNSAIGSKKRPQQTITPGNTPGDFDDGDAGMVTAEEQQLAAEITNHMGDHSFIWVTKENPSGTTVKNAATQPKKRQLRISDIVNGRLVPADNDKSNGAMTTHVQPGHWMPYTMGLMAQHNQASWDHLREEQPQKVAQLFENSGRKFSNSLQKVSWQEKPK